MGKPMSSISPAVKQVLQARQESQNQQVQIALMKKNLDAQKQTGDAAVALLEQAVDVQRQLADGHLDVRA